VTPGILILLENLTGMRIGQAQAQIAVNVALPGWKGSEWIEGSAPQSWARLELAAGSELQYLKRVEMAGHVLPLVGFTRFFNHRLIFRGWTFKCSILIICSTISTVSLRHPSELVTT